MIQGLYKNKYTKKDKIELARRAHELRDEHGIGVRYIAERFQMPVETLRNMMYEYRKLKGGCNAET